MTDEEKTKTRKRTKYIPVKSVKSSGKSALVEWNDGKLKRGYIPIEHLNRPKMQVSEAALKAATPYGVDWSKTDIEIDMELIDQELKQRGIWTKDDLKSRPQEVNIIIMRAVGLGRSALSKLKE